MSITAAIIISVLSTITICSIPVMVYAIIQANKALVEVQSYKKSTHTIQYVDPTRELEKEMAKQEAAFFSGDSLDRTFKDLGDEGSMI